MTTAKYKWAATGDVNAFFGLVLDNIAGLVLLVSLMQGVFNFPVEFSLGYMVPGTAIGVLVGDLLFFGLAFWYAKKSGKDNVTAMPLGLDTPSTFGMIFLVLGPAYVDALQTMEPQQAQIHTWHIGMCAMLITGVIKAVLSLFSGFIHRWVPRAGLLGSLAAIALVLIAFNPFSELSTMPIVGFAALALVIVTLIGRQRLPKNIPGALAAVVVATGVYYLLCGVETATGLGLVESAGQSISPQFLPSQWLEALSFQWLEKLPATVPYLGFIVPFAVATVVGGIDCSESAASVGDHYHTPTVIGIEALATLLASFCGGVVQTTPYIGHPAYKAMGGRAAYVLATALFIGGAGLLGYFGFIFMVIPKAAILPILIFIGIEITAQSFHVTPRRHYAAIAVACLPAIAKLAVIVTSDYHRALDPDHFMYETLKTRFFYANVLAGGFIFTSVIWASATAKIIDRRFVAASIYFLCGGIFVLFGVMHSPLPDDQMFLPSQLKSLDVFSRQQFEAVLNFSLAYFFMAVLMLALAKMLPNEKTIDTDEDYEKLGA